MIDFELIETFLNSRSDYLFKFSNVFNMYKRRFKVVLKREDLLNWEDEEFLFRVRRTYEFLKLNFFELIKNFYNKTNLEFIEFPIIPFVGLGYTNEWVDFYKNQIVSFLPVENINSIKNLISLVYKNYAFGYIMNINSEIFNALFYNNLRNLIAYGFSNYVSKICTNYSILVPIWLSQRSIYKIWLLDLNENLRYYTKKFLDEIDNNSFGEFSEWFLISRRGQYIAYEFFEFSNNNLKEFIKLDIEVYRFKFLEFYFSL